MYYRTPFLDWCRVCLIPCVPGWPMSGTVIASGFQQMRPLVQNFNQWIKYDCDSSWWEWGRKSLEGFAPSTRGISISIWSNMNLGWEQWWVENPVRSPKGKQNSGYGKLENCTWESSVAKREWSVTEGKNLFGFLLGHYLCVCVCVNPSAHGSPAMDRRLLKWSPVSIPSVPRTIVFNG